MNCRSVRTRRVELPRDLTPPRPQPSSVYQFRHVRFKVVSDLGWGSNRNLSLKEMLYQLSYQVQKSDLGLRLEPRDPLLKGDALPTELPSRVTFKAANIQAKINYSSSYCLNLLSILNHIN